MQELMKVCRTQEDPEAEYPMEVLMIYFISFWAYAHSQLGVFPEKTNLVRITNLSSSLSLHVIAFSIEQNQL